MKRATAKRTSRPNSTAAKTAVKAVTGKPIASLGNGVYMIKTPVKSRQRSKSRVAVIPHYDDLLIRKLGRALAKPGLSHEAVFGDAEKGVYSYYVASDNPEQIVRESANGKQTRGRLVAGKFRAFS